MQTAEIIFWNEILDVSSIEEKESQSGLGLPYITCRAKVFSYPLLQICFPARPDISYIMEVVILGAPGVKVIFGLISF